MQACVFCYLSATGGLRIRKTLGVEIDSPAKGPGSAYSTQLDPSCFDWKPQAREFNDGIEENWSGREDLNLRPPGPEKGIMLAC